MKKTLIIVGALLALLIVVAVAVPFFIPVETYKAQVEQRVADATGRKLTIAGPVKFSLLPSVAILAKDVRFANGAGFAAPEMATLAGLEIKLKVLPLLSGEIAIDSFVIDKPVINLEIDRQGRPNWQFATATQKPAAPATAAKPAPGGASGNGGGLKELKLDNVRLNDGRISFRDGQSNSNFAAEAINLRLSLPDLDSPFRADGGATWNGKPIKLRIDLAKPRAVMEGKTSAVAVNVDAELLRFDFKGNVSNGATLSVAGGLDLASPNVRQLAAWAGQPLDAPSSGLGPFDIKGQLAMAGAKASFTNAQVSLDEIRARGDVSVDTSGKVPSIKGRLDTNLLDLNPYLPPETASARSPSAAPAAAPRQSAGWSTEPIDLSGLHAANAELALGVEGLLIRKIRIGEGRLAVQLKDGKLAADLTELALYQGQGKGHVALDGSGKIPGVDFEMTLSGVQAEPLLKDAMDLDRLLGTGQAHIQVRGAGASQAALMQALDGKGAVKFENGAIKGINLAAMMRNVASAFLDAEAGRSEQTDFSELSGSYVIANGIVTNKDLSLLAPLLRVSGAGTVNLPQRSLNYRLEPRIAATTQGQGGNRNAAGLELPVMVSGPWDNLSYRPDLSGVLSNPQDAIDSLRGILGGQGGSSSGTGEGKPASPIDQLRGLFGR